MTDERPPPGSADRQPQPVQQPSPRRGLRDTFVDERDGPLPAMLLALTVLAGIVDATSILALKHVFVATMTGNVVFIGLGLSGAPQFSVWAPGLSLLSFFAGVLLGARACRLSGGHRGLALRNDTIVKTVLAVPVTVIAVAAGDPLGNAARVVITVLLAVSMGSQLALVRHLKVPDMPTVVLTLTMTAALTERGGGRNDPAVLRRVVAVLAFVGGVVVGGLLVRLVSVGAALALGLAIIVAVGISIHGVSDPRLVVRSTLGTQVTARRRRSMMVQPSRGATTCRSTWTPSTPSASGSRPITWWTPRSVRRAARRACTTSP